MESIEMSSSDSIIKVAMAHQSAFSSANIISTSIIDPHVCGICGNSFRKSGSLRRHMQSHVIEQHSDDTKPALKYYTCKVCYVNFMCPNQFQEHVRMEHSIPQALKCTVCGCFRPITESPKYVPFKCSSCMVTPPTIMTSASAVGHPAAANLVYGFAPTDVKKNKRVSFVDIPQSYAVVQSVAPPIAMTPINVLHTPTIHAPIPHHVVPVQSPPAPVPVPTIGHPLVETVAVDDEIKFKIFVPKKEPFTDQLQSTPTTSPSPPPYESGPLSPTPSSGPIGMSTDDTKIRRSNDSQFRKNHKCTICLKGFSHYSTLAMHRKTHTNDYKFICEYCSKPFFVADYYLRHKRVHTKEKPYKCDVCEKSFSQSNTLTQHRRIHTGEKPYGCEHCGKLFTVKDYLDKHIRTHTGEKPFICQICGKCYSQRSGLKTHFKSHYMMSTPLHDVVISHEEVAISESPKLEVPLG